jgi:exodeoxyribonuclease VII large subunit
VSALDLEILEREGARVWSVGELVRELKKRLEADFPMLLVEGEVSNLALHPSGHCYFTLKDDECQLRCCLFRSDAARLGFVPLDGECLVLFGRVTVYGRKGELQMVVVRAFRRGAGKAAEALEALKRRLADEGLFAHERKRKAPFYPRALGVVTSRSGAVIHDILAVLRRRSPATEVYLFPVRVQGDGAGREIARAIDAITQRFPIEVLIVGRGGGSSEDLSAFNDERVARAVFRSRVPVISAVGHEVDFTLCDLVADVRAPTASVAAELAVPDTPALLRALEATTARLCECEARSRARLAGKLDGFLTRYGLRALRNRIDDGSRTTDELAARVAAAARRRVEAAGAELQEKLGRLEALSPLATLGRGYSLVEQLPERTLVRSAAQLSVGDDLRLRFASGEARARVIDPRGTDSMAAASAGARAAPSPSVARAHDGDSGNRSRRPTLPADTGQLTLDGGEPWPTGR